MANYDVQVILQGASNLSKDRFINTLHFDVNAPDTVEGTADDIWSAYTGIVGRLGGLAQTGHEIRFYEPGVNPTGPSFSKQYSFPIAVPASGPAEVAICLSYATEDDPEASTGRRRGRIYVGPLRGSETGSTRPGSALRDDVLTFGQALASAGNASNTTWKLRSQADQAYFKIESIWTDDAWDTQRRRGAAPTAKQVQDVQ